MVLLSGTRVNIVSHLKTIKMHIKVSEYTFTFGEALTH